MEAERKPLPWRPYVVLLLSGATKEEKTCLERLQDVLSGALTPRERGVFKVVARSDLGNFKDNAPAEVLAGAFHALIEKDRTEYVQANATKFVSNPKVPASLDRDFRLASSRGTIVDSARGQAMMAAPPVDAILMPPMDGADDDMLSAAQAALEHDARDGAPSHIYVLFDYPASVAEVRGLITHKMTGNEGAKGVALSALVDSVVSVVFPLRAAVRRPSLALAADELPKPVVVEAKAVEPPVKPPIKGGKQKAPAVAPPPEPEVVAPVVAAPAIEVPVEPPGEGKLHKDLVAAAAVGGVEWTDFSFSTLHCATEAGEPRTMVTLTKELKQMLTDLAVAKCAFKQWLSTVNVVDVPYEVPGRPLEQLLRSYNELLDPIYEPSVGVAGILVAMKEAIFRASSKDRRVAPLPTKAATKLPQFIDHGDVARVRMMQALYLYNAKPECLRSGEPRMLLGKSLDDIEKEMWLLSDLPGVGFQGRKGMPIAPTLSLVERGVQDTELMQFHGMSMHDVHYTRKLLEFEAMLGPKWERKLRYRTFIEHLPKHILPQRLAALVGLNVVLHKRYYAPDDTLLVAGHITTPQGRTCTDTWAAIDWVRYRPPFSEWEAETLLPRVYLTPRTVQALGACVNLSHAELDNVREVTHSFFPSDHAVIHVTESPHTTTWLTVDKDWHHFGLRPSSVGFPVNFQATFEDASHLTISRQSGRTILLTKTLSSGLVVSISSDGSIQQEYANRTSHASSPNQQETRRVVLGRGTVISSRTDGSQVIMYANGHVGKRASAADAFWTIDEGGSVYAVASQAKATPPPLSVPITLEVDPESKAVIAHRGDGVVTVTHVNGSYLTQHADGTQMLGNGTNNHVIVRKEGYAEVSIDVDVNLTAQRHAQGMKIAVTKGGIRTRSVVRFDDGTTIEVDYDTRVIASVHGILRLRKPDGTIVIAQDNGLVEFRPRSLATSPYPRKAARDDEEEPDSSSGAYYFDCVKGSLRMSDHEHNHFDLTIGDGKQPPVLKVDLAGVVSTSDCAKFGVDPIAANAVVNDPLQPFLLILQGDGTGIEVLRPMDVDDYLALQHRDARIERVPCIAVGASSDNKLHVFTHSLGRFAPVALADASERAAILSTVKIPARASALLLQQLHNVVPLRPLTVSLVRRLREITPFDAVQFQTMMDALSAWNAWAANRELTKDQYAVVDPRDEETRAQAHAMEKKIAAAYKATRARLKAERLKKRERERLTKLNSALEEAAMTTLKEVENEEDDEEDGDDDEAHYPGMHSDDSDADSRDDLDVNVDDEYELLLTAFSHADTESNGRLNRVQTRRALVHALGFGVSQADVNGAIETYSEAYDDTVTFEVFARILTFMKDAHDEDASAKTPRAIPPARKLSLTSKLSPRPKHP